MEKADKDDETVCIEVLINSDLNYVQDFFPTSSPISSHQKQGKRKCKDSLVQDNFRKKPRTIISHKDLPKCDSSDDNSKLLTKKSKGSPRSRKTNVSMDPHDLQNVLDGMDEEIDNVLEETAKKNQLTTTNVKNILRHVITNEYVLAMVRNTMKSENNDYEDLEEAVFEPKLTRSKVKELQEKNHMLPWPVSTPVKQSESVSKALLEEEFSDENSSDEDYKPNEEECHSDDDNAILSPKSTDFDTSFGEKTLSPVAETCEEDADDENALVIALPVSDLDAISTNTEADKIALRTRSKLPLNDTPLELIEASFIAPDITVDMYDTHCDDEEWKEFLRELSKPIDVVAVEKPDEAEDDPEYNVLEDDDIPDELDLRYDNTMKVTRKELNALMAEIMESAQMEFNDCDDDEDEDMESLNRSENLRSETPCTVEDYDTVTETRTEWMIYEEKMQLDEQLRMYVQLLTQSYLLSFGIPALNYINITSKIFLDEIKMFAVNEKSAFYAHNLDGALDIVNQYESGKYNAEHQPRPRSTKGFPGIKSIATKKTLFNSEVFMYPELLPVCSFHTSIESVKPTFIPAEDNLIALGLEEFSFSQTPTFYINSLLVPTKSEYQIKLRIKNSKGPKITLQNPIKYFFKYNCAPPLPRMIRQFDANNIRAPKDFPPEYLPRWMKSMCEALPNPSPVPVILPKSVIVRTSPKKIIISKPPPPKIYKILPRNVKSPLKQLSPILKKYSQKRLMPALSSSNATRKSVRFAKRLVTKTPSVTPKSEITDEESVDNPPQSEDTESEISSVNSDTKSLKSDSTIIAVETSTTTNSSLSIRHTANGDVPDLECVTDSVFDISVETEAVEVDDEEIVDDEPESATQPDLTVASSTITKKQQSTSKKKNKQQRDLESTLALLQPNLLENDPKKEARESLFANSYLLRVTEALKGDPDTREKFLKALLRYQHCTKSPVKLYFEIKEILKDYPAMVDDFIAFLRPEQAVHCGKYTEYVTLNKIKQFLRKVEVHFRSQPQHLLKILKTFAQFKQQSSITSAEVLTALQPLLKNQSHLIEELNTILPDVAPPEHLMTDIEEITIPNSDGDNSSINSCEEVTIPDAPDPYGGKDCPCDCHTSSTEAKVMNKARHCVKCGIKFMDGRVYIQTGKVLKPAQVTYEEMPPGSVKLSSNDSKILQRNKQPNGPACIKSSVITEQLSKPEASLVKKDATKPIPIIQQNLESSEDHFPSTSKLPCDVIEDTIFPTVSNCSNKKCAPSDFSQLKDMIGQSNDTDNSTNGSIVDNNKSTGTVNSSEDHLLTNASQTVEWTREEDKLIIYNCQRFGLTDRSFLSSSSVLKNRTPEQVQERFFHIMELLSKEMKL